MSYGQKWASSSDSSEGRKGWVGVGQPGRNKLEQEDDGGVDNEAEEDSSERYESDYGNEDDSLDWRRCSLR